MVDILRDLVERSFSSWWWCYGHRWWLWCFHMHMIWCEWFFVTFWRYDICLVDSWKVMIRLFLLRKQRKLILMRSRGWVDIYMRHTLSQVDDIYIVISWELMMDIYRLLVWMLLIDAYGADHIWCMIVANDYHGLDIWSLLYMSCISFNVKVIKIPNL